MIGSGSTRATCLHADPVGGSHLDGMGEVGTVLAERNGQPAAMEGGSLVATEQPT